MRDSTMQNVAFYDLSVIRNLWEGRVRKYRQRQLKERERIEKSALAKVNQEWQYRIACKSMKAREISALQQYLQRSDGISNLQLYQDTFEEESDLQVEVEEKRYIFELNGKSWTELPDYIREMTYLREWHIRGTNIHKIPAYIVEFQELRVLELPRNGIEELPVVLGKLSNLRELNVSYNKLSNIPPELGDCENLEKLELIANLDLKELPFELSNLKKLTYLDISGNSFCSVPVCVLRMSSLQWLDLSNNLLTDLPEDIDRWAHPQCRHLCHALNTHFVTPSLIFVFLNCYFRLGELSSLFLHKNMLTYLPMSLANVDSLRMIVVSGDQLTCYPSRLSENPAIKFINLYDNPVDSNEDDKQKPRQKDDEQQHEKDFMQTYIETLKERETTPQYTTKVSLSCHL